jgi:hypothetical protein
MSGDGVPQLRYSCAYNTEDYWKLLRSGSINGLTHFQRSSKILEILGNGGLDC